MQHAAVAGAHDSQPFSAKYCDIAARLFEPLFSPRDAQHERDRRSHWMNMPRKPPLFQPGTLQVDWRRAETRLVSAWLKIAKDLVL
jgi:hypothetical protein